MALSLFQRVATEGPGHSGFGLEGGRAVETYTSSAPVSRAEMQDALRSILGSVEKSPLGRLNRTIPLCHPDYPWLFASSVEVVGRGHRDKLGNTGGNVLADVGLEAPPITTKGWRHVKYQLEVTFEPRPYTVVKNANVVPTGLSYYHTDGTVVMGTDSQEYLRYTDEESRSNPQLVSFTQGNTVFRTGSGGTPGSSGSNEPAVFAGTPWVELPDGEFRVVWFAVPYSVYSDRTQPMWKFISHVNQQPFWGWPAGALRYIGPEARKYTPTFPFYAQIGGGLGGTLGGGTLAFSSEKLCDVVFNFRFTMREATDPPNLAAANGSWVATGHNAMPWHLDRLFHTVTTPSISVADNASPNNSWKPLFKSAPMHLLFTCPAP